MSVFGKTRFSVHIFLKGGEVVHLECDKFGVETYDNVITKVKWENPSPNLLHINVSEIAAITSKEL